MPEFQTGRSPGERIFSIVAAIMFFAVPVGVFFYWLAPIVATLDSSTTQIFAYVAFVTFTGALWKVAFSMFLRGSGMATKEDFVWRAAGHYQKEGQARYAARYYLEALTAPWVKLVTPRGYEAYSFWKHEKDTRNVGDDSLALLADLLFVELWLEVALNSDSALSGAGDAYQTALPRVITNSERLVEFASLMREMSEEQLGEDGKHHPVILKLAEVFKEKSPRASKTVMPLSDTG